MKIFSSHLSFSWILWYAVATIALLCKVMPVQAHGQWGPQGCPDVIAAALGDDMDVIWSWPQTSARMVIRCLVEEVRK